MANFKAVHLKQEQRLNNYLAFGRKGSIRLERAIMDELDRTAAPDLWANNFGARIAFAAVAHRRMAKLIRTHPGPYFWTTLVVKQFAVPEEMAGEFDNRRIIGWTHQVLRGLSYIGMVEAAMYTNIRRLMRKSVISWHVHVIVWGADEETVRRKMAAINEKYDALVPGIDPAYSVEVTRDEVLEKTLYMLKWPQSNYRVWPIKRESVDPTTGEIFKVSTGRFKQKKGKLRPGEMARMCKVLARKQLHKLAFAAGDGKGVLADIRAEALLPLRREQSRLAAKAAILKDPRMRRVHVAKSSRRRTAAKVSAAIQVKLTHVPMGDFWCLQGEPDWAR